MPSPHTSSPRRPHPVTIGDDGSFGFRAWMGPTRLMHAPHVHTDVEWNFVLKGSMSYFAGGRIQAIGAGELGVFWGGMPHRLIGVAAGTRAIWLTIPLAWVMRWELATSFTRRLLAGDLLIHSPPDRAMEEALLMRWVDDLSENSAERRSIALLEVEAHHRRLALASPGIRSPKSRADLAPVEKLTAFVSTHYEHDLDIAAIAAAADLHPNYAMQLFKRTCGMSLWDYLTRLRVSHAQRLLLLTDWKVSRIALDSGFNSHSRFYESFVKICGKTPRAYRRSLLREAAAFVAAM